MNALVTRQPVYGDDHGRVSWKDTRGLSGAVVDQEGPRVGLESEGAPVVARPPALPVLLHGDSYPDDLLPAEGGRHQSFGGSEDPAADRNDPCRRCSRDR